MDKTTEPQPTTTHFVIGLFVTAGIAFVATAAGVAVLVFASYGCGRLFARWLPFSPFEATVVSLLSLVTTIAALARVLASFPGRDGEYHNACELCDGCEEVEDDEVDAEDSTPNDGLRAALYATGVVKPNAPCPCGSGSRYGKCCGDGRLFRQRG